MWEMVYPRGTWKTLKRIERALNWAILRNRLDGYALQIRKQDRDLVIDWMGDPIREAEDTR